MMVELLLWGAVFIGGGLTLSAILGATWAVVEDWRREQRRNRG